MRIHRLFPGDSGSIQFKLRKALTLPSSRVWLACENVEILDTLSECPRDRILLEVPWAQRNGVIDERMRGFSEIVFCGTGDEDYSDWMNIATRLTIPVSLLVRPQRKLDNLRLLESLQGIRHERLFFEFLPWDPKHPNRWTVREIRRFIFEYSRQRNGQSPQTFPGLESWDDRIDSELELEPSYPPKLDWTRSSTSPKFSIVIPTHDNRVFLESVVRALFAQRFDRNLFEILVVDDGSQDGTPESIEGLFAVAGETQISYTYFPRRRRRERGDHHYRAGIARNLGALQARGEWLIFLDSDIVVSPEFLNRMLSASERADVVQCERHHLRPEFCQGSVVYDEVDLDRQTYIEEDSYWGPFFRTHEWSSFGNFWKYTCTYCLMMRAKDFWEIGRFKRTFTTYGFEDVDLGYELARKGRRFLLLHEKTLHLTPRSDRSEYGHSRWIRHRLLSRTAKTFFRQHLDPGIYDLLRVFMVEPALWHRWKHRISGALSRR